MTIDQAIDKASAAIDALLQQRLDAMALQMIGDGVDPTKPPANEDSDGDWQRVTFGEILQLQGARDAAWKREALAQIWQWVAARLAR